MSTLSVTLPSGAVQGPIVPRMDVIARGGTVPMDPATTAPHGVAASGPKEYVTCPHCGTTDLHWRHSGKRWRLYRGKPAPAFADEHICNSTTLDGKLLSWYKTLDHSASVVPLTPAFKSL